jgi:sulfonate dioxygenase
MRALKLPNPREVFERATVFELTPTFGSDVRGLNLAELDNSGRDQIALEVCISTHRFC